jgi:hypothetical protein
MGNHFQLSQELHFRTNHTKQKALCPKSLASFLLSHRHQPECVPVNGVLCPQINNSKLCKLRQISNRKLKAINELYLG